MLNVKHEERECGIRQRSFRSVDWAKCPHCVNGNMYQEYDDERVCLQCGYREYGNSHRDIQRLLKLL